ncbi:hypothetical protein C5B42_03335 [Candidatus Cerribacteria bacterium 'Amazon FNV 2010 28 9']|uniref:Uncharacterized protein n=1 Tax=Candidatus Cerribacteria bacterium 'Amazon FNV 2010 28 9' TaxID=2081795 RepID=A0A317JNG8_9BACT|nr:MAG: hypothetical protein C5B42_03335 [Candidatus Cerribacteria bacterium 'Amazon FNV 2010 28 9']
MNGKITASNILYSATAGTGISISGTQDLTISNTDLGSAQNIFKTIGVDSTSFSAGNNSDTFGFVSGNGITLSADTTNKKITINANGGALNVSGWEQSGNNVLLQTLTNSVGIGTANPKATLDVSGTASVSGAVTFGSTLTVTGTTALGVLNAGTTTLNSLTVTGDTLIDGDLTVLNGVSLFNGINNQGGGITNAGAITGATGFTSSGTITFSGLSPGIAHVGIGGVLSSSALNLSGGTTEVTGTLGVTDGGTGLATYTKGDMLYADATNHLTNLGIGGDSQVLTITNGLPVWGSVNPNTLGPCPNCVINNPNGVQTIVASASAAIPLSLRPFTSQTADIFNVSSHDGSIKYLQVDNNGNIFTGSPLTIGPSGTDPILISPSALSGSAFTGTITSAALASARTWTLPDATGTFCLTTGNCAGVGGNFGGSGTLNFLAKFSGSTTVNNSLLYDNGTNIGLGTISPTYSFDNAGNMRVLGNTVLGGTVDATGAARLASTLNVSGATTLQSSLNVSGTATLSSTLAVTGNTTVGGTFGVTSNATFDTNTLYVDAVNHRVGVGTITPGSKLDLQGGYLNVSGGASIAATYASSVPLTVQGSTGQTGDLTEWRNSSGTLLSAIDASGNFTGGGTASFSGTLTVPTIQAPIGPLTFNYKSGQNTWAAAMTIQSTTGNVGIGNTNPLAVLDVANSSITTTNGISGAFNGLSSGVALNITSTSTALTSGQLGLFDWSPGSATTATGDLFSLNVGANGTIGNIFNVKNNGSSVFAISQNQITAGLPTQFTGAGDIADAYDLMFTNPTASFIKSSAPLTVQSGEVFNSSDLTLRTFNSGNIVLDAAGGVTLAQAQNWNLTSSTSSLNFGSGLLNLDTTNNIVSSNNILNISGAATISATYATGRALSVNGVFNQSDATTTTGNSFTATASAITTGNIVQIGEGGNSAFSGNGLFMDIDNTGGGGGSFTGNFLKFNNAGSTNFVVASNGAVGIGNSLSSVPSYYLDVQTVLGSSLGANTARFFNNNGNGQVLFASRTDTNQSDLVIGGGSTAGQGWTIRRTASNVASPRNLQFISAGTSTAALDLDYNTGNVGIGTTVPGSKLDIQGGYLNISGGATISATYTGGNSLNVIGSIVANNTTVSAGTLANPAGGTCTGNVNGANKAVYQSNTNATNTMIFYETTAGKHSRITSATTCSDGSSNTYQILTLTDGVTAAAGDTFSVYTPVADIGTNSSGFFNNAFAINLKSVASTVTGGFDLAESYPTDDNTIGAGDVVSMTSSSAMTADGYHGKIAKTGNPYDTKLFGVVSTNAGVSLGEAGSMERKVALAGRVPVKVNLENGSISIGDPLTSSSTPGQAMKATKNGYIIGRALENYDGTSATVMMIVEAGYYTTDNNQTQLTQAPLQTTSQGDVALTPHSDSTTATTTVDQQWMATVDIRLLALEQATASAQTTSNMSGLNTGIVTALNTAVSWTNSVWTFLGDIAVNGKATFNQGVTFVSTVVFNTHPTYNDQDVAGYAKITTGSNEVDVPFKTTYQTTPIITVTPQTPGTQFGLKNQSPTGFTIFTQTVATQDALFNWTAVAVTTPLTVESTQSAQLNSPQPTIPANNSIGTASGSGTPDTQTPLW